MIWLTSFVLNCFFFHFHRGKIKQCVLQNALHEYSHHPQLSIALVYCLNWRKGNFAKQTKYCNE